LPLAFAVSSVTVDGKTPVVIDGATIDGRLLLAQHLQAVLTGQVAEPCENCWKRVIVSRVSRPDGSEVR
jgi:hypothetical protein